MIGDPAYPELKITCDHAGGPHDYHCALCCPAAAIGASGNMEPCLGHEEGIALAVLEARRTWIDGTGSRNGSNATTHRFLMACWLMASDIDRPGANERDEKIMDVGCGRPEGNYLSIDLAERLAIDILAAVGAARRGEQ